VHNCDGPHPRRGPNDTLSDIHGADLVLIDAPCTGTGTWRPQSRRQMADASGRALEVRFEGPGRGARIAPPIWSKPGGAASPISRARYCPRKNGEQNPRVLRRRHPEIRGGAAVARTTAVLWDKAEDFARRHACNRRRGS